mgnify:CR=1 FL=1
MTQSRPLVAEERTGVASGRLKWALDEGDLTAGRYRIRFGGPEKWELLYRGHLLERHHRERQRRSEIARYSMAAGAALLLATLTVGYTSELLVFIVFLLVAWAFLSAAARALASVTPNLLDPYRTREEWEPSDWWNRGA